MTTERIAPDQCPGAPRPLAEISRPRAARSGGIRRRGRGPLVLRALVLLAPLLLTGCLEFDAQDVFVRHDAATDRLDLMLVYRGLYHQEEEKGDDLADSIEQLEKARTGEHFALWNTLPAFDLSRKDLPVFRLLADHLVIENGRLFRDEGGRLCGYQFLRITRVSELLKRLNSAFARLVHERGIAGLFAADTVDDETRGLLAGWLRKKEPFFSVKGASIEWAIPCSDADHAKLRASIFDDVLRYAAREVSWTARSAKPAQAVDLTDVAAVERALKGSSALRFFRDNDVAIVREGKVTRFSFGVPDRPRAVFRKAAMDWYDPALMKAVLERGIRIDDLTTEEALLKRFDEWLQRESFAGTAASRPESRREARPR